MHRHPVRWAAPSEQKNVPLAHLQISSSQLVEGAGTSQEMAGKVVHMRCDEISDCISKRHADTHKLVGAATECMRSPAGR